MDVRIAKHIIQYLNELVETDRCAIAALIANRVPCNKAFADHPTCQVAGQHGGFHVGILGLLNGLCGADEDGWGLICAEFTEPEKGKYSDLVRFRLTTEKDKGKK